MNCVTCNQELKEGVLFCTSCGTKVEEVRKEVNTEIQSIEPSKWNNVIACMEGVLNEEMQKSQMQISEMEEVLNQKDAEIQGLKNEMLTYQQQIANLQREVEIEKTKNKVEAQTVSCPNCSNIVTPEMIFCNECGTKIR